jgi:predicted small secreted protein
MQITRESTRSQIVISHAMRYTSLVLLCGALSFLAACNTVEGVGEDVQSAGRAVERTADKAN